MFNFKNITHIITNPNGHAPGWNYSLVGSVPAAMMQPRTPTPADVMAGRVHDGVTYGSKKWETIEQIKEDAAACGAELCSSPTCAPLRHVLVGTFSR